MDLGFVVEHDSYGRGDVGAIGEGHSDVKCGRVKSGTLMPVRLGDWRIHLTVGDLSYLDSFLALRGSAS